VNINPAINCETCIKAKRTSKPFKKSRTSAKPNPNSIALDLVGPLQETGVEGEKYALVIVHYETNATFVEPIKRKGDQTINIKSYVNRILAKGFKIHAAICDNSKENLSNKLLFFYADKGIEVKSSNIYTSNQNPIAERRIRTLMDKTRCLLLTTTMEKKYWPFCNYDRL
jgi:hypothetical protein